MADVVVKAGGNGQVTASGELENGQRVASKNATGAHVQKKNQAAPESSRSLAGPQPRRSEAELVHLRYASATVRGGFGGEAVRRKELGAMVAAHTAPAVQTAFNNVQEVYEQLTKYNELWLSNGISGDTFVKLCGDLSNQTRVCYLAKLRESDGKEGSDLAAVKVEAEGFQKALRKINENVLAIKYGKITT